MQILHKKKKEFALSGVWFFLSAMVLAYVVFSTTALFNVSHKESQTSFNQSLASPTISIENEIRMDANMIESFSLDKKYIKSFETFRNKMLMNNKKTVSEKEFIEFLNKIQIKIGENGQLIGLDGGIVSPEYLECYMNGFTPGKSFIKPNCF